MIVPGPRSRRLIHSELPNENLDCHNLCETKLTRVDETLDTLPVVGNTTGTPDGQFFHLHLSMVAPRDDPSHTPPPESG